VSRHTAETGALGETAVWEIMTRNVIIGVPQDDIISVVNTMTEKRFRHLPIMQDDKLIGIISIGDILKAQRDTYRGEIDTLETQIMAGDDV
jgi:CBS domain-containing protein